MIKDIKINNFKSIYKADIKGFRRINLLFGKNDCGKTTLLESIYLLMRFDPSCPLLLNTLRGYDKTDEKDLYLNFHNLNIDKPITISSDEEIERKMDISLFKSYSNAVDIDSLKDNFSNEREDGYYGLKMNYFLDKQKYHSEIIFQEKVRQFKIDNDKTYKKTIKCKYLPINYDEIDYDGFKEIIQNEKEDLVLETLKMIEPTIKDIQMIGDDIFVGVDGLDRRIPINCMGDGIRRLLSMISAIYKCRSIEERQGVLLIDAIDSCFHYSVMKKIWKVLLDSAKRNGVQIFATTHNIDSIKGFNEAIKEENANEEAIAFKLLHISNDDELKALAYDSQQINYLLEHETEIR